MWYLVCHIEDVWEQGGEKNIWAQEEGSNRLLEKFEWVRLCGLVVRVPGNRSRGPRFDSRCCQIFWEVVGLERVQLSLMSTTEELLGRNSSGSGLENREYGRGDPSHWPRGTLYPQKLALTSPTGCGLSVGVVSLRTEATEFVLYNFYSSSDVIRMIRSRRKKWVENVITHGKCIQNFSGKTWREETTWKA
jgi:hypothetical protein